MPTAYSGGADFSGIGEKGNLMIKINKVIHKAFAEVNEEGTETAAATAITMISKSAFIEKQRHVVFRADHPFIFIIQHNKTGAFLFIGKVNEPK